MATVPVHKGLWNRTTPAKPLLSRARIVGISTLLVAGGTLWFFFGGEPVVQTGVVAGGVTHTGPVESKLEGQAAIDFCRKLLVDAQHNLAGVETISAVFHKQERINDKLQPLNVMDLRVRRSPLSIYMQWQNPDKGQQIIWREGAHDGKILVSPAGWKRKLVPMVKIATDDEEALAVSRRPVTNIGIWHFTERLTDLFEKELLKDPAVQVRMSEGHEISGRPCYQFAFEHPSPSSTVKFKQVLIFVDKVLGVPVACENYFWPEAGSKESAQLEESYLYRDLTFNVDLTDADFDHKNPVLKFGAKQ